ncbi:alcohol oxidase [Gloeophyllum trabeum ATCC 11539]|uniref:Alcohol oxidase n=1 Tax=Gloeophyllum trabeum (strain ATCC 11539 / FP-39264 / Madison 617) TaxID=670483 RepID=S7QHM1_GLOTA|nr:alcohol oxidase [Gloeophyllum trabeum ATCC 11539]EPQ58672.1 alcohol oxidase [Gloeophyllum trabeum ATCC 11539]
MGNLLSASTSPYETDPGTLDGATFDYIVIGGGTAGCVVASRLSEDPRVRVLLVEAGGRHDTELFTKIPIAFAKLFKTKADWAYHTVPQPHLRSRALFWPRAKILGGCSSMNAMMYQHCSPSDFDRWPRGWRYQDFSPYFRKAERFTPHVLYPEVRLDERGDKGLWQTSYSYLAPVCGAFIEAAKQVGLAYNPDINTPRGSLGVTKFVTSIDAQGRRSSSATAYLSDEVLARENLTVLINTTTTRVLFSSDAESGEEPRAVGVEVARDAGSPRFRMVARREVILSAGTTNTPHLLNLSGIGARDELAPLGIEVVKHLPAVGKNLTDHLVTGAITFRARKGVSLDYLSHPVKSLPALARWFLTGTGPATSNVGEVAAFFRADDRALHASDEELIDNTSGPRAPDVELMSGPLAFLQHGFRSAPPGAECYTILPALLRPLSSGRVRLAGAAPFAAPAIDPGYLAHPNDIKVLARGVRLALRIARAPALQAFLDLRPAAAHAGLDRTDLFYPGDADPERISDAEIEEWIRGNAETLYHCVGTARMGEGEEGSVVDAALRVHGVQGLRVVDASVFPEPTSGHPAATVVAVAEKAAEMIRDEWRFRCSEDS